MQQSEDSKPPLSHWWTFPLCNPFTRIADLPNSYREFAVVLRCWIPLTKRPQQFMKQWVRFFGNLSSITIIALTSRRDLQHLGR